MLVKSFISHDEKIEILNWIDSIEFLSLESIGRNGRFDKLSNLKHIPKCINAIRKRCIDIIGDCMFEPLLEDFVNEIKPDGYVWIHTDPTKEGYKHIRFNILIQKPDLGGHIYFDGEKLNMDESDCFILDTSKEHGLSMVYGKTSYKSIVFGFLVPYE